MAGEFAAFGKMPALGDFFRLNPPPGFVPVWDAWLQAGLLAARAQLGDRWDACYMSAPIWRFSLAAGLAGPAPLLGVMMPSVDRVGRQFPLTLVVPVPAASVVSDGAMERGSERGPESGSENVRSSGAPRLTGRGYGCRSGSDAGSTGSTGNNSAAVFACHLGSAPLFEALELLALDTLDDAMSRERLGDALASLGRLDGRGGAAGTGAGGARLDCGQGILTLQTGFGEAALIGAYAAATGPDAADRTAADATATDSAAALQRDAGPGCALPDGTGGGDLSQALAAALIAPDYRRPSVWSMHSQGEQRLIAFEGLPPAAQLAALFDLHAPLWRNREAAE